MKVSFETIYVSRKQNWYNEWIRVSLEVYIVP